MSESHRGNIEAAKSPKEPQETRGQHTGAKRVHHTKTGKGERRRGRGDHTQVQNAPTTKSDKGSEGAPRRKRAHEASPSLKNEIP